MARGDSVEFNKALIKQNGLRLCDGDLEEAYDYVCEAAAKWYEAKGAGFDREGGPQHDWTPKQPPKAIVTREGK